MFDFERVQKMARDRVKRLTRTNPELFPEYQEMKAAERDYNSARRRLDRAIAAWRKLRGE